MKQHNPPSVAGPFFNYSHGIEVPPDARWLHVSGQVAINPDGSIPPDFQSQVDMAFRNVGAVLASAGMGPEDLVKVTIFLTRVEDIPALRIARDAFQASARPASTLVVVQSLARPEWLVEIEAIAAKSDD